MSKRRNLPPLTVSHPQLLTEWHPSLNNEYSPEQLNAVSHYRAWWQCSKRREHVWQRSVQMRAENNSPCPLCILDQGSLASLYPDVAKQWHPTKNGLLRPEDVFAGTERKVWWLCAASNEHVYEAAVYAKTVAGSGCHFCTGRKLDSKRSLKVHNPNIAREWHPTRNENLRAEDVSYGSKKYVWWRCTKDPTHEWQDPVCKRTSKHQPGCPFCYGYYLTERNRLSAYCPEIAAEWHPTKNRKLWTDSGGSFRLKQNRRLPPVERGEKNRRLQPTDVSIQSHEDAWWQCKVNKKHVWHALVCDRVRYQSGCPFCTNQKVADDNNLAARYPKLLKLWHPTRNLPLLPTQVVPGSAKRAWWRCAMAHDHVWQTPVNKVVKSRNDGHRACPFCAGRKVCSTNNLAARCPAAAKLWHPTKNRFEPTSVLPKSNKTVWWLCHDGHEFKSSVFSVFEAQETRGGTGCPYCSGRRASTDDNLAVRFPVIAKLWWHPTKNLPLRPEEVRHGTGKKVWWRCAKSKEHEWQAAVCSVVQTYKRAQRLSCSQCRKA